MLMRDGVAYVAIDNSDLHAFLGRNKDQWVSPVRIRFVERDGDVWFEWEFLEGTGPVYIDVRELTQHMEKLAAADAERAS